MIIEGLVVGLGGALMTQLGKPRGFYGLTRGWWKGAFTPDNAAIGIANMIDSDVNCEWWESRGTNYASGTPYYNYREFYSEHLQTAVYIAYDYDGDLTGKRAGLVIRDKEGKSIKCPVSAYDDFVLIRAVDRWKKRKKELDEYRARRKTENLVNERVTKGYIDLAEMIDTRILGKETSETADALRATLPSPDEPKKEEPKKTKATNTVYYIMSTSSTTDSPKPKKGKKAA